MSPVWARASPRPRSADCSRARGLKVAAQKLDPYINVDPGTMSPYQHGEVYVTEDGAETDLDLGHYERFIDEDLNKFSNLTTGKVYWNVLNKERARRIPRRDRSGHPPHHQRDQVVHLLGRQKDRRLTSSSPRSAAPPATSSRQPFLEAIRQVALEVGRRNCLFIHVTLVPYHLRLERARSPSRPSTRSRSCAVWASPRTSS